MVVWAVGVVLLACAAAGSVLAPTYALPPASFPRDRAAERTVRRLVGGHLKIKPDYGDPAKNSFANDQKSESGKFLGVVVAQEHVGWNQGVWDDGMLMSSAGEGKDKPAKSREEDEDKKTLSDQVAEGKYGLIQNEIFAKNPKRPGIVSYEPNPETRSKDNLQTLGGLKKEEIWLAEDHLLVLKGGSFPERTKEADKRPWPAIDDYEAPRRQVKLPQKPRVPPPFPVQLSDDGPLVFLTPNGSVPAAVFPPFPPGQGEGSVPAPPFPFPPGAPHPAGDYQGNSSAGGAPFPNSPFPFLPGNASEGPFPFPPSMNASFPEGFPPGAAFLPPPSNQSDLYDEDDPSIYYPPPYNFSYRAEYNNRVPAGPLVPGIVLPPPPDFFAPLEEKSTTTETVTSAKPVTTTSYMRVKPLKPRPSPTPAVRKPYKPRPTTTSESPQTEAPTTATVPPTVEIVTSPRPRPPQRVVQIPSRTPIHVQNLPEVVIRPKTEKPVYKSRTKLTSKPLSVSVIYDEPQYEPKPPSISEKPYIIYSVPDKTQSDIADNLVTSTPVPLRAYYSNSPSVEVPTTKLQPVYNRKPTENSVASFYFYDEQPKTSPSPSPYYDGRNYYKALPLPVNQAPAQNQNVNQQNGFNPPIDVAYGSFDQADALFLWPQKQGPHTLTQEYFSIQKPRQQNYIQQQPKQRPDFYQQIADIQQTFDLFTTTRPKSYSHRPHAHNAHKPKAITSRPVYQFSYQSKPRQELSFRAPKLDPEPFRPMVSYSRPLNHGNDFNAILPSPSPGYRQQYLIENVKVSTESPNSSRYYPKTRTREDDYDDAPVKEVRNSQKKNRNHIPVQNDKPSVQFNGNPVSSTASPVSHGYYTQQDERYFDDLTKSSFDVFGKKIEGSDHDASGLGVTPPLGTVRTPIDNNINLQYAYDFVDTQSPNPPTLDRDTVINDRFPRPPVHSESEPVNQKTHSQLVQQQKPPSLADDTLVNDRLPRPSINPDSEFIPIPNPGYRTAQQYNIQPQVQKPQYAGEQFDLNRPSLGGDTAVNYRRPLPPINPDAEWINPVNTAGEGRPGSFVSYRLPGEEAHVYFLTPQAANRERYRGQGYGR